MGTPALKKEIRDYSGSYKTVPCRKLAAENPVSAERHGEP